MSEELACAELIELVTEFLEGALPASDRARFEAHLADCGDCTLYFDQMRLTIKTLGKLTEETIEPQARAELLKLFRNWKSS